MQDKYLVMGLFYSIMFGIIAGWFIKSTMAAYKGGIYTTLITGLLSGIAGTFIGVALGLGDASMFNLWQVLLSITLSIATGYLWGRMSNPRNVPQPKKVIVEK
jgi:uncharacterized membrane protein YeaQ/YmgE (transglycosylase-associated protein family)